MGLSAFSIGGIAPNFSTVGVNNLTAKLFTYRENQYQFSDDVTMTFGKHTITTGVATGFQQMNATGQGLGEACCGQYNFTVALTNSGNANIPTGAGGSTFASFLLGVPNTVSLRTAVIPYYYRWKNLAGFFQDDFKLKSNLTLNMGLRYQYNSPREEKYNRQANLDLNDPVPLTNAAGAVTGYTLDYVYAGTNGSSRYLDPPHKKNFEPRFGLPGHRISHGIGTGGWLFGAVMELATFLQRAAAGHPYPTLAGRRACGLTRNGLERVPSR